jgi:DNA replication and repair protein RecF
LIITNLSLVNFRIFSSLKLDLAPGVNIFAGKNAQGKTSLLEAIYVLAIGKAFRAENEKEIVSWNSSGNKIGQTVIDASFTSENESNRVIIAYNPTYTSNRYSTASSTSLRKEIRVNGIRNSASDLIGIVTAVLFSANDMELVLGPPSYRRRYMDILLSQSDKEYLSALQNYQKILQQRNQLLRLIQQHRGKINELEFWDTKLAKEGASIIFKRFEVIDKISALSSEILDHLTNSNEDLAIVYKPSLESPARGPASQSEFLNSLEKARKADLLRGITTLGPHRDDLGIIVNGINMGLFSSRGQARTLALSMKLAEAKTLETLRGYPPLVLLDDVLSELDEDRRNMVLNQTLKGGQTFITSTTLEPFNPHFISQSNVFTINQGVIQQLRSL